MNKQQITEWLNKARVVTAPGLDFGIRRRVGLVNGTRITSIVGNTSEVPWVSGRQERQLSEEERDEFIKLYCKS